MKTCPNCGFLVNDTDRFCTHCGVAQENVVEAKPEPRIEPEVRDSIREYDRIVREMPVEDHIQVVQSRVSTILGIIGLFIIASGFFSFLETVYVALPEVFNSPDMMAAIIEIMGDVEESMIWNILLGVYMASGVLTSLVGVILGTVGIFKKNGTSLGKKLSIAAVALGAAAIIFMIVVFAMNKM